MTWGLGIVLILIGAVVLLILSGAASGSDNNE